MALNGTCWAARLHTTISGPNSSSAPLTAPCQWRSNQPLPTHMPADAVHRHAACICQLQQRRRHVFDAACHDDLVEGCRLFPAVVAIGLLGLDVLVLGVALLDQLVVEPARALGERLDDLDGVGIL